ncbi:conserved Plasmodium protein, unknown function [Plasmodium gallinaceum]|uniref:Uncharacterized protein n=1 Tax=Plasmodium gallinaceum TaxID=5849 RepID=A0A1J1GY81_PLAGA|nr:conserved Plasmodium protein, unknown function [Plasmodium gallinaceum]CRG97263.1 conserved Plasmodium protein, unknown function [Plasmodium gallinaceum]
MNFLNKTFFIKKIQYYYSSSKFENIVPLYERKSRIKFKKEKLLKKIKIQILHLDKNKKNSTKYLSSYNENLLSHDVINQSISEKIHDGSSCSLEKEIDNLKTLISNNENNNDKNDLIKRKIEILNEKSLTFIHLKRLYFLINNKENEQLIENINNSNFLKICIFTNKKNIRNRVIEKEFLRRVDKTELKENSFFNEKNFPYILEYIHYIGLSNIKNIYNSKLYWNFNELKIIYNRLLDNITKKIILNNDQIINIISINDKYLYFNKYLFDYINSTISINFNTLNEHEITYICKYLSKMLFFFSIEKNDIKYNMYVHRLIKRYICKSIVFSNKVKFLESCNEKDTTNIYEKNDKKNLHMKKLNDLEQTVKNNSNNINNNINKLNEKNEKLKYENFKMYIKNSSFVNILNKELKNYLHEYKYYNLIDIFEFYTIFEINNENMMKRFINETSKFINIMKYGYHSKALILFSLNRNYLQIENEKSIRRLIRRIPYMLNFHWPIEIIIETIIACSFFSCKEKIFKNLIIYLKNNIKKCIHPIILVNLLKSFVSINKINFVLFQQILSYLKKNIKFINISYIIHILKNMSILNYKDFDFFFFFLSFENVFNRISHLPKPTLINFFHLIYRYNHFLEKKKSIFVNNIFVKSNLSIFYTEYILFLMLSKEGNLLKINSSILGKNEKILKEEKEKKKIEMKYFLQNNNSYEHELFLSNKNNHLDVINNEPYTKKSNKISHIDDNVLNIEWHKNEKESYTKEIKKYNIEKPFKDIIIENDNNNNSNNIYNDEMYISHVDYKLFELDVDDFIYFLKGFINLKITNLNILYYSIHFLHKNLYSFNENHIIILLQFYSEHLIAFPILMDSQIRKAYSYLHIIVKSSIINLPDYFLPHCIFSVISFYFTEIVLKNNIKNIDLLENIMSMFCNKLRGGLEILTEENEEKKVNSELLNIISQILQMLYVKAEKRMPDDLYNFCKHIKEYYYKINENINNDNKDKQNFISFFSNLLKNKKINHFIKYSFYPYTLDIVIENEDYDNTQKKKALIVIDKLDNIYLKNIHLTDFFYNYSTKKNTINEKVEDNIQKEENCLIHENYFSNSLKPYESIREWFLINNNFSVSYISINDWKNKYSYI